MSAKDWSNLSPSRPASLHHPIFSEIHSEYPSLGRESSSELLSAQLLSLGRDLKVSGREEKAASLFAALQDTNCPEEIRREAAAEFKAMAGQGDFGFRAEYLLGRLIKDSTAAKTIVPMTLGTAAYGVFRAAGAARLAAGGFYQPTVLALAPRILGFAGEVSVFSLASRALRQLSGEVPTESPGAELASSALTLGALKFFSQLGMTVAQAARLGAPQGVSTGLLSNAFAFLGLYSARRLEQNFGLKPRLANETLLTDTFAALVSLKVGQGLGQIALGPRMTGFQRNLGLRFQFLQEQISRPNYAWALMSTGSGRESSEKKVGPRFAEALSLPELKYHVENGSRSHARELVRRADRDPEAAVALREAIAAYRESLEKLGIGNSFVRGNPSFYRAQRMMALPLLAVSAGLEKLVNGSRALGIQAQGDFNPVTDWLSRQGVIFFAAGAMGVYAAYKIHRAWLMNRLAKQALKNDDALREFFIRVKPGESLSNMLILEIAEVNPEAVFQLHILLQTYPKDPDYRLMMRGAVFLDHYAQYAFSRPRWRQALELLAEHGNPRAQKILHRIREADEAQEREDVNSEPTSH